MLFSSRFHSYFSQQSLQTIPKSLCLWHCSFSLHTLVSNNSCKCICARFSFLPTNSNVFSSLCAANSPVIPNIACLVDNTATRGTKMFLRLYLTVFQHGLSYGAQWYSWTSDDWLCLVTSLPATKLKTGVLSLIVGTQPPHFHFHPAFLYLTFLPIAVLAQYALFCCWWWW